MSQNVDADKLSQGLCEFLRSEVLGEGVDLDNETSLADIGVDSYSLMEIILYVEREFGISLPMDVLTPENTQSVKALTACIQGMAS